MDPDQARQNVGPNLDPNCLTLMVFLKIFLEKVDFEIISRRQIGMKNFPGGKELMQCVSISPDTKSHFYDTHSGVTKIFYFISHLKHYDVGTGYSKEPSQ